MDITVAFIGNAATLIAAGEITLLTDPNFPHAGQRRRPRRTAEAVAPRAESRGKPPKAAAPQRSFRILAG
ncbi:hypothetical protein [Mycolicibacterium holsaticum]|uniref:Uncharacterized protein n=1 Tax=Mycolicibacterium holsaticum TaxID=152142 RepID=A0A1E3R6B1_9MYCO|nr:hypothetical protein BHQ17_23175 [Mycolicibacterium holsaticum]